MLIEDYPKNFQEFLLRFQTDDDCWDYLFALRWTNGFNCPKCNCKKYYLNNRKLAECNNCGHQISVTAGTIFMVQESRYYFGFMLYGGLQHKRLGLVPVILRILWGLEATKQLGHGCIS